MKGQRRANGLPRDTPTSEVEMQEECNPAPLMRRCGDCHAEKPPTDFSRNSSRKDGLSSICKPCDRLRSRKWHAANPERARVLVEKWARENPERTREIKRQWKARNPTSNIEWVQANPERRREIQKKYNDAHRDEINRLARERRDDRRRASARAWNQRNKDKIAQAAYLRRARLRDAGIVEAVDVVLLAQRDRNRCGICGKSVLLAERTIDHIVPVSKGGEHSYANTQLAHSRCNSARGNRGAGQIRLFG